MNAFPEICEIIKAFGQRAEGLGVEDESWAGYYSRIKSGSSAPEDSSGVGDVMASGAPQQAAVISGPGMSSSHSKPIFAIYPPQNLDKEMTKY